MKTLFAYSSLTGNTEYFCTEVYKNLKEEHEIDLMRLEEVKSFDDYDLLVLGFWVDRGTANKKARKIIKSIKNKKIALLATLGASPDSEHGQKVRKNVVEIIDESSEYLGISLARGKVDEKLTKRIKFLPLKKSIKEKMYESSINSREPNQEEIEKATTFIKGLLA